MPDPLPDLLFEIGTEELPAWYLSQGVTALGALLAERLEAAGLEHGAITSYATPRRLAVWVDEVAPRSRHEVVMRRGPAAEVALDETGAPTRAATRFAEASGVRPEELTVEDTERGRYVFARRELGGEEASALLPALLAGLVADLPAPRKMRWGEVDTPFVRPVAWLLARFGGEVLPLRAAGREASGVSYGHRFLAPGPIEIVAGRDYRDALRAAEVLADPAERLEATLREARRVAVEEGLEPLLDRALLAEVANLIEAPFALLGSFEEDYLELPEEVLSTVMIHHQRFFPTRDAAGRLAPRFVAISNNRVEDEAVVRRGYEGVLAGRLSDAGFFWDADRRKSLSQHAWALSGIQFQHSLGSMADKVARVGEGAQALADALDLGDADRAVLEQALPIFRADLATDMVVELPELEGTMARIYALAEGLPEPVALALEEGIMPRGPEDSLPRSAPGAVLALADRLDKLIGFFALGQRPTGSADPYALRRDGLALARLLNARGWRVPPGELVATAALPYRRTELAIPDDVVAQVTAFLWDRVASLLGEEGVPVTVIRAAVDGDPPVIVAARRAHLLNALSRQEEFPALMELYRRAANLAREAAEDAAVEPKRFADPHEAPLHRALPGARRGVEKLLAQIRRTLTPWDLGRGPAAPVTDLGEEVGEVLALKVPLDAFLDNVLVMVEETEVRRNRLALLAGVREVLRGLGALERLGGG